MLAFSLFEAPLSSSVIAGEIMVPDCTNEAAQSNSRYFNLPVPKYPSQAIRGGMEVIRVAADQNSSLLLLRETGRGKDFATRLIHACRGDLKAAVPSAYSGNSRHRRLVLQEAEAPSREMLLIGRLKPCPPGRKRGARI